MKIKLAVTLKKNILDPQGDAVKVALKQMNFKALSSVRQGKLIELDLDISDRKVAHDLVEKMARELLVNEVMETYEILMD